MLIFFLIKKPPDRFNLCLRKRFVPNFFDFCYPGAGRKALPCGLDREIRRDNKEDRSLQVIEPVARLHDQTGNKPLKPGWVRPASAA